MNFTHQLVFTQASNRVCALVERLWVQLSGCYATAQCLRLISVYTQPLNVTIQCPSEEETLNKDWVSLFFSDRTSGTLGFPFRLSGHRPESIP